jgi:NAD+ diphosphatase
VSFDFSAQLPLSRHAIDRDHAARGATDLIDRLWADAATRVLPLWRGRALLVGDQAASADAVTDAWAPGFSGAVRLDLLSPDRVAEPTLRVYLGRSLDVDSAEPVGTPLVAARLSDEEAVALQPDESQWVVLRTVADTLSDRDAGAFAEALGVVNWHESHTHCPRCGAATSVEDSGWTRRCPVDGSQVFPRTDPAVIVLITDRDDRVLLGSNAMWENNRYSLLAGFVEPGESLEAAVLREMHEESGLRVTDATYIGSQPWPFPASIMCGFTARLADDQPATDLIPDGEEILDLRWFSRADLRAEGDRILLPGPSSIARALLDRWLDDDKPNDHKPDDEAVATDSIAESASDSRRNSRQERR